jgi:cytochrome c biogenesis protein CcmG, thiol:disulfide interchange protein DsbE
MDHDDLFDDDLLPDPTPGRSAAPVRTARLAPQPVEHVAGVDVLADPGTARAPHPGSGSGSDGGEPGLRERIRSSRFGTLAVLLVTAALVAGGAWLVNGQRTEAATAAGTTVVTLPGTSTVPAPKVGAAAQDFTLSTIDGKTVSLDQFKGKAVWVVFGASWCAACQAEVADIQAAHEKYGPQGLVVLAVNINESQDAVRSYANRVGTSYLVGADDQSAIADAYRVSAIPAHFFVDRTGVLREIRQGGVSTDSIAASVSRAMAP